MLNEGSEAPAFTAVNQESAPVALADHRGSWVLLWWYPKADTPG